MMTNKLEQKMDAEFRLMAVNPFIYHFTWGMRPFTAVTIVTETQDTYSHIRDLLFHALAKAVYNTYPSTIVFNNLRKVGVFGVAICNARDSFNRQRGRIIAKGRLLKHLRGKEGE